MAVDTNMIPGGVANRRLDLAPRNLATEGDARRTVVCWFADDVDAAREVLAMLGLDQKAA